MKTKGNTAKIRIKATEEEAAQIRAAAKVHGQSVSDFLAEASTSAAYRTLTLHRLRSE
jgi:uncharacterized protein (DUF1778 family)